MLYVFRYGRGQRGNHLKPFMQYATQAEREK